MPTATIGGLKDVCVTQLTVPDAMSSPFLAVSRKRP